LGKGKDDLAKKSLEEGKDGTDSIGGYSGRQVRGERFTGMVSAGLWKGGAWSILSYKTRNDEGGSCLGENKKRLYPSLSGVN